MESIDPRQLLVKVVKILDELDIAYMVTGGMAVFVWGRPRFTADIDIVIALENKNINSLASALQGMSELGYVDKDAMREAFVKRGEFNFIDGLSGVKVDFWVIGKDVSSAEELKRHIVKDIAGYKVNFISPEDLILSKLRWYKVSPSSRHIEDIESVLKISSKILDKKYLKKTAVKLNLVEELNQLLN